jgi:hypothetical protein
MQKSCNLFYMSAARRSWIATTPQTPFGIPEHARKMNTCALHIDCAVTSRAGIGNVSERTSAGLVTRKPSERALARSVHNFRGYVT